jgi:NTP pyrophosphatase (non-canonical NTP hydrolase)
MNFNEYQAMAWETEVITEPAERFHLRSDADDMLILNYLALKLNGEAGEVAELVGKAMRDGYSFFAPDEEYRDKLLKELGDVQWYVAGIATTLDADLDVVAKENIKKLHKRQKEGNLHGSGSDR